MLLPVAKDDVDITASALVSVGGCHEHLYQASPGLLLAWRHASTAGLFVWLIRFWLS